MATQQPIPPISSSASDAARGRFIPWIIVAFFISFILLLSSFVWIAFEHQPSLVTEHAYDKGLAYNATLAKEAEQEKLGWHATITADNAQISFALNDASGQAITDAEVKGWLVHPAAKTQDQQFSLAETRPGIYVAPIPGNTQGLRDVRMTALKDGTQFQASRLLSLR